MTNKIHRLFIYFVSVCVLIIVSVQIGAELITQYVMYINGYTERYYLADDMGFGFLLMLGLIPEIIVGLLIGLWLGKKLNTKF